MIAATDRSTWYASLGQEDCLERLLLAVEDGGCSVVYGEAGYGKSSVKLALLREAHRPGAFAIGRIDDPRACRTDVQFLRALLEQFGVAASGRTALDLTTDLLRALQALAGDGRRALLVVDDGHHLSGSQLELLRTALSASPTLSVAIFAEPELAEKIGRKRALAQRVTMEHTLNPLNRRDTAGLVVHRLGGDEAIGATDEALTAIHAHTGGVPRAIVDLCARCRAAATAWGRAEIDRELVAAAIAGERAGATRRDPAEDNGRRGRSGDHGVWQIPMLGGDVTAAREAAR